MIDVLINQLRVVRDGCIDRLQFRSAVFISDKILAFPNFVIDDVLALAKCLYRLKEYQRAAFVITSRDLHISPCNIQCCLIVIKCYYKSKNYREAMELVDTILHQNSEESNNWKLPILMMHSFLFQALDNQASAKKALQSALDLNFTCYEAFSKLTSQHMMTKIEELELLNGIIAKNHVTFPFLCAFMRFFYFFQLKKYDKPDELEFYKPFDIFGQNIDCLVACAERHYYNFKFGQALEITNSLFTQDLHNMDCLLIHISCLMEFKRTNDLFELSQNLINLYPEIEVSWYSLGCYYHLIDKIDLARRFLHKCTMLNNFFAPAWILYGHSFSQESEHDQAISAYFKASHYMPGCHFPLFYIGVEYILTDNSRLAEKFVTSALEIAPEDPLALHELGIIAFNSKEAIKAERYFRSALKILKYNQQSLNLPNRFDILLNNMGHALRKLGRYSDAIEFHKKAIMMSPQDASCYSAIGFIYCMLGKWSEAIEYLDYAHGLFKLLRHEDVYTKTLLENHALKQFANLPRYNHPFVNIFNDTDFVEALCNQAPKQIREENLKKSSNDLDESIDDSLNNFKWNVSMRLL